jgi:hypothetical protein
VAATGKDSGETETVLRRCQYCGKTAVAGYRCLLCDHEDLVPPGQEAGHGWARCIGNQRERLGRLVREAWVRFWSGRPDAKPTWLTSYDTLPPEQQAVDDAIGAELYKLGRAEALEELPHILGLHRDILRQMVLAELFELIEAVDFVPHRVRAAVDRALGRMNLLLVTGQDPQAVDPHERVNDELAELIAAKQVEIHALLGADWASWAPASGSTT